MARRLYCFHIINHVPERHINLASGTCNKIMSALSFKIMKGSTQKLCRIFHELALWCLGTGPIEFRHPVILKKQQHINIVLKKF